MSPVLQQPPFPIHFLALPAIILAPLLLGRSGGEVRSIPVGPCLVLEASG